MKINPQHLQKVLGVYNKAAGKSEPTSGPRALPKDALDLSDRAGEVSRARRSYDALPDVRAAKVADLRARIQNGTYALTDDQIAGAMLAGGTPDFDVDEE
jgi:flagellar biosynthesis anti-sigma factor FlgM